MAKSYSHGKRMVREDLIAKINEGYEEYSAGTGITIDESNVISVDSSTVAFKSEIPSFEAGTGITINESDVISVDSSVAMKSDIQTYSAGTGIAIDASNAISVDSTVALVSDLASVAFTGSYSDLSGTPSIPSAPVQANWNESDTSSLAYIQNKPSIPVVSGSNDGTNWTSITLNTDTYAIPQGGSAPSNMVTTDTLQDITGTKSFSEIYAAKFRADNDTVNFGYINNIQNQNQPVLNFKIYAKYEGSSSKSAKLSFKSSSPSGAGGNYPTFSERAYISCSGDGGVQIRNDTSNTPSTASITLANKAGNGLYFYDSVTRFRTISGKLLIVPDEEGTIITTNQVPEAPITDGTYRLTCTVSSGVATYSWELVS